MKRFWIVLLSAALVMAFAMTASAQTTVRFSGSYYAQGQYFDNQELKKDNTVSTAFFSQRFRLMSVFQIATGLTFTTRADIHERMWGSQRAAYSAAVADWRSTPYTVEDENIGFDFAFATFDTKVGRFQVGYQPAGAWGTAFGDNGTAHARLMYALPRGAWTFAAILEQQREGEIIISPTSGYSNPGQFSRSDADNTFYYLNATNRWKTGDAGLLYIYSYTAQGATGAPGTFRGKLQGLVPYARANFGPLFVEAELTYHFGTAAEFIRPATPAAVVDIDAAGLAYYANLRYKMGPLTVGGLYAFAQGDDPATLNKNEGTATAGWDFKPTLLLFNQGTVYKWAGEMGRRGDASATFTPYRTNDIMSNASLWQINAAYDVTKDLRIFASYTSAKVNQQSIFVTIPGTPPTTVVRRLVSDSIGSEFDVTASYKIFGNLEYVVGAAYFWTGDAFKGADPNATVGNNYLIQHRLNLTF